MSAEYKVRAGASMRRSVAPITQSIVACSSPIKTLQRLGIVCLQLVVGATFLAGQTRSSDVRRDINALDIVKASLAAMILDKSEFTTIHAVGTVVLPGKDGDGISTERVIEIEVAIEPHGGHRSRISMKNANHSVELHLADQQTVVTAADKSHIASSSEHHQVPVVVRSSSYVPGVDLRGLLTDSSSVLLYLGTQEAEDTTLDIVEVISSIQDGSHSSTYWFFNHKTHLPVKSEGCMQAVTPMPCAFKRAALYADFKQYGSLFSPSRITVMDGGTISRQIVLTELQPGVTLEGAK